MNPLKWLVCWWYRRHLPIAVTKISPESYELQRTHICARCGTDLSI